jgi:hypothetical protein
MLNIPLQQFPRLAALRDRSDFLEPLRQGHPQEDDFIATASRVILQQVLQQRDPNRQKPDEFDAILKLGFSPEEISHACARALFHGEDTLVLARRGWRYKYARTPHLTLYAVVLAFLTLIVLIRSGQHVASEAVAAFLVFEPLLALAGAALALVYFYLLKLLLRA